MGGKQSTASGLISDSPMTENIQVAYKNGEFGRAEELIKTACHANILQVEKVRTEC